MISFVGNSWQSAFEQLISSATSSITICSPYIGAYPCRLISNNQRLRQIRRDLNLYVLTDLCRDNLLGGSTDPVALADLAEAFPQAVFRFLPSLHAKVYVADETAAIVTSANMTFSGLRRNYEFGVRIEEKEHVQRVRAGVLEYGNVGSGISGAQLRTLAETTRAAKAELATIAPDLSQRMEGVTATLDAQVAVLRTEGQNLNAVFERAIPFLLRQRAMTTPELHEAIRAIHPDLCNDSEDRVINGQHFGKKWKHAVRSAQWHLKARGIIELSNDKWQIRQG
ncbi:MAG: phospholipase D family protein [Phycisphaerae bacterium]|nr:phospholipase D family protein [Phycisphaerae bacterium]